MKTDDCEAWLATIVELIAGWEKASLIERRLLQSRIEEHRYAVSDAYGAARGWERTPERFPIHALTRMGGSSGDWESEFTDHHSFWMMGGRPVAVVAHLYGCEEVRRSAARTWAAAHGLKATFPTDYPSWWSPGRTTLIEIAKEN